MEKRENTYDLIVVGGGPSGMITAGRAAELGSRVLLLERNKELGNKLKITGGGRCNITNAIFNVREFLSHFPESKEYLYSPFSKFSVEDTFSFFEKQGLPLVIESRNRAFPESQSAEDVAKTLARYMRKHHVEIRFGMRVQEFVIKDSEIIAIEMKDGEVIHGKKFALATGGSAAPGTGSTGDGFRMLEDLGHKIYKPTASIVPLTSDADWIHRISGLSLSFMKISFIQKKKAVLKKVGKILFTHFGVSGPLILNSSFEVKKLLNKGTLEASIDLFPDTEENELDRRVWRLFEQNKNKMMKNIIHEILPKQLALEILSFKSINLTEKKVHEVTKEERKKLVKIMKDLRFRITGTLGLSKAVVADGGVNLEEVNFKNMTSKKYPNLYLLGDILNINRPSGGFSLQLCWTTGFVAGSDVSNKVNEVRPRSLLKLK